MEVGDGKVYALDAATGRQRWSFAVGRDLPMRNSGMSSESPEEFGLWDFYLSSPAISEGKVYIGAGGVLMAEDLNSVITLHELNGSLAGRAFVRLVERGSLARRNLFLIEMNPSSALQELRNFWAAQAGIRKDVASSICFQAQWIVH